jgi:hypothetical protein
MADTKPLYRTVTVWHNVEKDGPHPVGMLYGYKPGHAMCPVFTYVTCATPDSTNIPEDAFKMFNAPEDYLSPEELALARRYRANRLRSLSIGDIVQVDDTYYACESFGFRALAADLGRLNVQPDAFSNWGGTRDDEIKRVNQDFARGISSVIGVQHGEEAGMRSYQRALEAVERLI